MNKLIVVMTLLLASSQLMAKEIAGMMLPDSITAANGDQLVLNGAGVRSKFWIDIYVGSLYLTSKTKDIAGVMAAPGALRIQMDFVYSEVEKEKLITAWQEGFENNQNEQTLKNLQSRMQQFYGYFDKNAVEKDQYVYDYVPGQGTTIIRNQQMLGVIPGADFKDALLQIWLGNEPADSDLKEGMLGQSDD